ncbi:hypothetical protein [Anderseniella sp. Alg231-50]|uniref:hypothetical protein n=1 Tax=Anderseniella sp. Alg231-50 TaxID=1922226 RepID=UPI000D5541E3
MKHLFWKIVLSLKYWRVLLGRTKKVGPEAGPDASRVVLFAATLFLLVPICIGLGFGYLAWQHGQRLESQRAVDKDGVAVTASIEGLKVEKFHNDATRMGDGANRTEPSLFCVIQVRYSKPGSSTVLRKVIWLEDDTVCSRYKLNDPIAGRLLPDNPDVLVLDEGRLAEYWYWICLLLLALFSGGPLVLLARVIAARGGGAGRPA